ncbi:3-oxoacyl-[acyl-carrier protein] reductase [Paenibacillus algorifonticola]|uniref:3-oxoacyl-[acyl-carrier protein] reductase n=1 Tax=Paenibacillus algorifonticola TaxID=684063 RepID=A0A1I2FTC9_9BACL|nr:SDR family oxidoreductase [Paenibacillus algorifonticola]SFF08017.1 3-oxoacyl-[acyl-carrier protein] reductase [Paenibacillus algorifonticola]
MTFRDHVILITGVTRGIGRAIALRFIAEGAVVAGIYVRDDEAAEQLRGTAEEAGGRIILYKGSVSDHGFVANVMKDLFETYGRLDVLVNNAGRTNDQMALFMEEQQWNEVLDTNFIGTCCCSQEAVSYMLRQGRGAIINMVSVSGIYGREAQTNYAASKGAIMGLTKLYARLYASQSIQVSAIAPGMIETEMAQSVPAEKMADFLKHTAAGRLGSAEEVADAVMYLAGPLASYHAGQTLKIDGGFLR